MPSFTAASIAPEDVLPIVLVAGTWGHLWAAKTILCNYDDEAVISVINTSS